MKTKTGSKQWLWHLILLFFVLLVFYPLLYMVCSSFKSLKEIYNAGLALLPKEFSPENYQKVFTSLPILKFLGNSLVIAVLVTVFKMVTSLLASYALVFMNFKHRDAMFYFFTMTMYVPFTVLMIPNYLTINKMGLMSTILGVALPQLADAMGIFRMRQAMRTIPKSLVEAARVDGVGHMTALLRIVAPMLRPAIIAQSMIFFINSWNEYFWPMLILRGDNSSYTLTLALQTYMNSESGSAWGTSMALATITTLVPLALYLFTQRYIISTFMSSGIKE